MIIFVEMKHSKRNIIFHELIGLRVRILEYPDSKLIGLSGKVLDETLKTFLIETKDKRIVRVLKEHGLFEFMLPDGEKVIIRGAKILARPEDRLKNIIK